VALTRTERKGMPRKESLVQTIRECVDSFPQVFVLASDNMRNKKLQEVRSRWGESR
jgi:mRNA turnover protein 4